MILEKPVIGVVLDYREGGKDQYSANPYYVIKSSYIDMLNKAGGKALLISYDYELIDYYLDLVDGLMIVGGYFDINPKRYGEKIEHDSVKLNKVRENFEFEIVSKAIKKNNLPYFGICNGMQLLNIAHGGDSIQNIEENNSILEHEQSRVEGYEDYSKNYHEIFIEKDSKLYNIIGKQKILTNSSHHQAVKSVKENMKITAKASDGIIEAIEHKYHPFSLGVQWHPEFNNSEADSKLFFNFVESCKNYKKNDKR